MLTSWTAMMKLVVLVFGESLAMDLGEGFEVFWRTLIGALEIEIGMVKTVVNIWKVHI